MNETTPEGAELQTITPELAAALLEKNTRNRRIRPHIVKLYAEQMRTDGWRVTGDTIKIASDDTILDGQHRLEACVDSGAAFQAYIIKGLSPDVFDLIDAGLPRRTTDALQIRGEVSVALLAAVLSLVQRIELGTLHRMARGKMTSHQALEVLARHPGVRQFVTMTNGTHKLVTVGPGSISALCYYLFSLQNKQLADEFFRKFSTGVQLEPDEPVYLLREVLLKERDKIAQMPQNMIVALYFRAWIYTKEGRRMKLLKWWRPDTEKFPDIGPITEK